MPAVSASGRTPAPSITPSHSTTTHAFLWTLDDSEQIVKMATADGAILQRISMAHIAAANPGIDILDIRQDDLDRGNDNSRHAPVTLDGRSLPPERCRAAAGGDGRRLRRLSGRRLAA